MKKFFVINNIEHICLSDSKFMLDEGELKLH